MPFSPLPGSSPLPAPGQRPPSTRALRLGAFAAVPTFLGLLGIGALLLPHLLFLAPLLQAQAGGGVAGQGGATFQGFVYTWSRTQSGGGYNAPASRQNLNSEAHTFHMNAVIIPVIGDMPQRSDSYIAWHNTDAQDIDTLPEAQYIQAIKDARAAGLVPILELVLRQQDTQLSGSNQSSIYIGRAWFDGNSNSDFELNGSSQNVVAVEQAWVDNYTAFAVQYARLSQQYHLPYFIIGDQLLDVTTDTANTTRNADPAGIPNVPGENLSTCTGRRACEWQHVTDAARASSYSTITTHKIYPGGGYGGKLIYAASWTAAPAQANAAPEFESISWWDAVDFIGVDAYFPLTRDIADASINTLSDAWQGAGSDLAGQGNILNRLQTVADRYHRQIIFTAAGYPSVSGANNNPSLPLSTNPDPSEQQSDMAALLHTFTGQSWWLGVFWYADEPLAPRTAQPGWATSSNWAGDTIKDSKLAGQWLAQYYQPRPLPCGC